MKRIHRHCLRVIFFAALGGVAAGQSPSDPAGALRETRLALDSLPLAIPSEQVHGQIGVFDIGEDGNSIVIDLGRPVIPDEVVIFPARFPTGESGGFPAGLEVDVSEEVGFTRPIRLGRWSEETPGSGNRLPFLRIPGNGASGRFVRIRVLEGVPDRTAPGEFATLGEILVLEKNHNTALRRPVRIGRSIENPPRWQVPNLTDGYLWCVPLHGREVMNSNGYHSRIETSGPDSPKWVEIDLGEDHRIDALHLFAAHPRDYADTAGFGFPPRFRITGRSTGGGESVLFDSGEAAFPNPGAAPVMIPGNGIPCRWIRVETDELWRRTNDHIFALAELQVWSGGKNVALEKSVTAADATISGRWTLAALVDGSSSRHVLLSWTEWLDALSKREALEDRSDQLTTRLEAEREAMTRRWIAGAAITVVLVALAALLLILLQRRRAAREQKALTTRLASDLHDELGASLSHLALQSDLARRRIAPEDPVSDRLSALSESARETLDHLRDMVWLLSPVAGTWEDLESRLEGITSRLLDGLSHTFVTEGERPAGSPAIERAREIVLFLKEALTNVQKHAAPGAVTVGLLWTQRTLTLKIEDNGKGFDPATSRGGRGLHHFEIRAKALHGTVKIDSSPGEGTRLLLTLPLVTRDA